MVITMNKTDSQRLADVEKNTNEIREMLRIILEAKTAVSITEANNERAFKEMIGQLAAGNDSALKVFASRGGKIPVGKT